MIAFIHLERYGAGRIIPVNVAAIAYYDDCLGGSIVAFGSGETIRMCETPDQIAAKIDIAIHPDRAAAAIDAAAILDLWRAEQPTILQTASQRRVARR